ncbi:hypothetical protein [Candidatus Palauibacter sp.]|uniref:hypothetical protein n=1 Tax=Candidatus Palauibacter sp. TaxID=3101350 RepID=UPI003B01F917
MVFRRKMDAAWGVLVGGLLALAVGCGDGTTEPDDTPLTMTEAEALFEGMRVIQQDTAPRIIHASEDSIVVACPLGGQLRRTVMFVDESVADTLRLAWDFTGTRRMPVLERGTAVHRRRRAGGPRTGRLRLRRLLRAFQHRGLGDADWTGRTTGPDPAT